MRQQFWARKMPQDSWRVACITGASTGIGAETAVELARRGFEVVLACRDEARAENTAARCAAAGGPAPLVFGDVDLASLASVRSFAERLTSQRPRLDVLVLNAGTNTAPESAPITTDGLEHIWQVNYLAHFLLVLLLLPALGQAPEPRVVCLSSVTHRFGVADWDGAAYGRASNAYSTSKLAMTCLAFELHRRSGGRVRAFAVNPGAVNSDIWRHPRWAAYRPFFQWLFLTPEQGCVTSVEAATAHLEAPLYLSPYSGKEEASLPRRLLGEAVMDSWGVFVGPTAIPPLEASRDPIVGQSLWEVSWALCEPHWPPGMEPSALVAQ